MRKAVFNWSGGKDSALALQKILKRNEFQVIALLTTVTAASEKSTIHGIPLRLLDAQAKSIGIPLHPVFLDQEARSYEQAMRNAVAHFKEKGVRHFIFGDILLEEVKNYRQEKLGPLGIEVVLPLWGKSSQEVIQDFLNSGIKSTIVVTEASKLDASYIGKDITRELIENLPPTIDPCGEYGEYHSFVYDGSIFNAAIKFEIGPAKTISHDFKMNTGAVETFYYWTGELQAL